MDFEPITPQEALEAGKGLTFEAVWSALMENRKQIQDTQNQMQEAKNQLQETKDLVQETTRQMQESKVRNDEIWARIDKSMSELSKNIGGLGNSIGELSEAMFAAELWKKFNEIGFSFTKHSPDTLFFENDRFLAQADFFLENGEYAIPVEVKRKLTTDDINDHLERIEKIRGYMDARADKRKLLGAVASVTLLPQVMAYAHKKGLFVIVQTGETVAIAEAPEGFVARQW